MKMIRLIAAAAIAIPAMSALAQSTPPTPPTINDGVRAQLAQDKTAYAYPEASGRTQASIDDGKRSASLPHQITGVNVGRYSLSVVRPTF